MSTPTGDRRPGAFSTNRGRKIMFSILLFILFGLVLLLTKNTSKATPAGVAPSGASSVSASANDDDDGETATAQPPQVNAAVPDAFNPGAQADSGLLNTDQADPTDGASGTPSTQSIDPSNPDYVAMTQAATSMLQQYCGWQWKETPEAYVHSIPGLTTPYAQNVLKASTKAWPHIVSERASSSCAAPSPSNIVGKSFSGDQGVLDIKTSQKISTRSGSGVSIVTFEISMAKVGGTWEADHVTS